MNLERLWCLFYELHYGICPRRCRNSPAFLRHQVLAEPIWCFPGRSVCKNSRSPLFVWQPFTFERFSEWCKLWLLFLSSSSRNQVLSLTILDWPPWKTHPTVHLSPLRTNAAFMSLCWDPQSTKGTSQETQGLWICLHLSQTQTWKCHFSSEYPAKRCTN